MDEIYTNGLRSYQRWLKAIAAGDNETADLIVEGARQNAMLMQKKSVPFTAARFLEYKGGINGASAQEQRQLYELLDYLTLRGYYFIKMRDLLTINRTSDQTNVARVEPGQWIFVRDHEIQILEDEHVKANFESVRSCG